jgi:sulfur carrier protein ThiS
MELVVRPHIMSDRSRTVANREAVGMTVQELVDSLEGFDPRVKELNLFVMIDTEVVPRSQWVHRRIKEGDKSCRVSAVLQGGGGGAKRVLSLIAIIVLSIYAGPLAGMIGEGFGLGTTATLLVKAGIMLVGTLIINAIFAPPRAKNTGGSEASNAYTFSGQQNSVRPALRRNHPRSTASHRVFPDLAAAAVHDERG